MSESVMLAEYGEELTKGLEKGLKGYSETIGEVIEGLQKAVDEIAKEAIRIMDNLAEALGCPLSEATPEKLRLLFRQNTNNWRKMHGLPMRRRRKK